MSIGSDPDLDPAGFQKFFGSDWTSTFLIKQDQDPDRILEKVAAKTQKNARKTFSEKSAV